MTVNTRWRFNTTPEQVKAFQAWLKSQIEQRITNETEEALWQRYTEEGFRKGAGRSFDDVRAKQRAAIGADDRERLDFYAGTREEFLRSSFGRPESVDKVKLLAGRSFDDLENITTDMSTRMSRTLTDGLVEGKHPTDIASDLADDVDIGEKRAQVIARTEIIRAHAEGQLEALGKLGVEEVGVAVEWSTAGDDAVCPKCEPLEGVVLKLDEAQNMIPRHPNCLLPGNYVQGRVTAALEAYYSGEAVEILTANGCRVSITINHPILTVGGFRSAGSLEKGNYLVGYQSQVKGSSGADVEDCPTPVEKIFKAFNTVLFQKAAGAFDFNGDEEFMVGEIKVVLPSLTLVKSVPLQRQCEDEILFMPTRDGSMGGADLSAPLFGGHSLPLQNFSLALSAQSNSTVLDAPMNDPRGNSKRIGDSFRGFPGKIPPAGIANIYCKTMPHERRFGLAAELDVPFRQPAADSVSLDAQLVAELFERFPGKIACDQVINVRRFHYFGPVYDVETTIGYFTSSQTESASIITRNCRCAWIPANVGEDDEGQKDTKRGIDWAIKESLDEGEAGASEGSSWPGGDKDIGKRRPESILNRLPDPDEEECWFHRGEQEDALLPDYLLAFSRAVANVSYFADCERDKEIVGNAFCPTGEGGGIDPSCSSSGSSESSGKLLSIKDQASKLESLHSTNSAQMTLWHEARIISTNPFKHVDSKDLSVRHDAFVNQLKLAKADGRSEDADKWSKKITQVNEEADQRRTYYRIERERVAIEEGQLTGKLTVTEGEMSSLLSATKDAYHEAGIKSEKGRYPYTPEVFKTSDLSGMRVRKYIELPDGRIAHPDELTLAKNRGRIVVVGQDIKLPAYDFVKNVFCPTGPGGGVKPDCSPTESGSPDPASKEAVGHLAEQLTNIGEEQRRHNFVHLGDLRQANPGWSKEQFDKVLHQARLQGKITLSAAEGGGGYGVSERDKRSAVYEEGSVQGRKDAMMLYASVRNVENAFCPTGEGGGIDPSCSPGGEAYGAADSPAEKLGGVVEWSTHPGEEPGVVY